MWFSCAPWTHLSGGHLRLSVSASVYAVSNKKINQPVRQWEENHHHQHLCPSKTCSASVLIFVLFCLFHSFFFCLWLQGNENRGQSRWGAKCIQVGDFRFVSAKGLLLFCCGCGWGKCCCFYRSRQFGLRRLMFKSSHIGRRPCPVKVRKWCWIHCRSRAWRWETFSWERNKVRLFRPDWPAVRCACADISAGKRTDIRPNSSWLRISLAR